MSFGVNSSVASLDIPGAMSSDTRVFLDLRGSFGESIARRVLPWALSGMLMLLPANTAAHQRIAPPLPVSGRLGEVAGKAAQRPVLTVEQASRLRFAMSAFAADWDDPAMDVYDAL